jgi:hypothetical protein
MDGIPPLNGRQKLAVTAGIAAGVLGAWMTITGRYAFGLPLLGAGVYSGWWMAREVTAYRQEQEDDVLQMRGTAAALVQFQEDRAEVLAIESAADAGLIAPTGRTAGVTNMSDFLSS